MTNWTCPTCDRGFANPNQWHSCQVADLGEHFNRTEPHMRGSFDAIVAGLPREVRVEAVKTAIHLGARRAMFASVNVRRTHLRVGILLDRRLQHRRVERVEVLSRTRYSHGVDVWGPDDVDAELLGWLNEAYDLRS